MILGPYFKIESIPLWVFNGDFNGDFLQLKGGTSKGCTMIINGVFCLLGHFYSDGLGFFYYNKLELSIDVCF